jgi:hypothetical protein
MVIELRTHIEPHQGVGEHQANSWYGSPMLQNHEA